MTSQAKQALGDLANTAREAQRVTGVVRDALEKIVGWPYLHGVTRDAFVAMLDAEKAKSAFYADVQAVARLLGDA